MVDLREFAAPVLHELAIVHERTIVITPEMTGAPPGEIASDGLVLRARFPGHVYHPSTRVDLVDFFADKPTYRALGVLLLATIFHRSSTTIELEPHPDAEHLNGTRITKLIVDSTRESPDPYASELLLVPTAFGYWPQPSRARHPLHEEGAQRPLPEVTWSNDDDMLIADVDWETRSVVRGFGEIGAAARVAELLLDIGLPATERAEYVCEGPAGGAQTVTPRSAELRLWVGYDYAV